MVAKVLSGRRSLRPAARMPANACGEVTSWIRWRSTYSSAGWPGGCATTWRSHSFSNRVRAAEGMSVSRERLQELVKIIGLAVVADEARSPRTAVVVHQAGLIVVVVDDQKLDRTLRLGAAHHRIVQQGPGIDAAVDADDAHARNHAGLVGGAVDNRVQHVAVGADFEADRIIQITRAGHVLAIQDVLPAARLDAPQGRHGRGRVEALVEVSGPIIGHDLVE